MSSSGSISAAKAGAPRIARGPTSRTVFGNRRADIAQQAAPSPASRPSAAGAVPRSTAGPAMTSIEDFRMSTTDLHTQPSLPPALQSLEAFKTRRSFLNGQLGFDTSFAGECGDSVGDEDAWLQSASPLELSELCSADYSEKPLDVQRFCTRVREEGARLRQHALADAGPCDTDEEDDPF